MNKKVFLILFILLAITIGISAWKNFNTSEKTDWDYIQDKGELVIGYEEHFPLNYTDSSGNLVGFESEFATALCEKIGIKPIFQSINWDSKEIELNAKNIDCIWNGMSVTKERAESMDLSDSYMNNKKVIVTRKEDKEKYQTAESLNGATVVANTGSINEKIVQSDPFFSQATYVPVDSQSKSFMEVAAGTADVAVVDYVASIGKFMQDSSYKNLTIAKTLEGDYVYAIAFRKNSPETLKIVNQAIQELKDEGALKKIAEKYGLGEIVLPSF